MTPISHSLFGFTTGFILSPITQKMGISRKKTVLLCTLGAVIPDVDAVSLLLSRKIYFGSSWYSHHALSHSIFGAFLIAFGFTLFSQPMLTRQALKNKSALNTWAISFTVLLIGCLIHLPGDMVTLPGVWKGIPLFAPFSWDRFGGWTHMPWKDYYLIYLSISTYLIFSIMWLVESRLKRKTSILPIVSIMILSWAINHTYRSRFVSYPQWEKEQKHLVGEKLYRFANRAERNVLRLWQIKTLF